MDPKRFDTLARTLSTPGTRRGALGGLLAGTLSLLGLDDVAARKRRQATAEGPCGNGSAKANACEKDKDCCTRFCDKQKGRCRCKKLGQGCKRDRNCCASFGQPMTCLSGSCQTISPGCTPTSCAAQGKNCGSIPDGCGGTLPCGSCPLARQPCANNVCGTCVEDCAGKACGADNDCGGTCTACSPTCTAGTCAAGQECVTGSCTCTTSSCAHGCCAGTTCEAGNTKAACGEQGVTCVTCSGDAAVTCRTPHSAPGRANGTCARACPAAACPAGDCACYPLDDGGDVCANCEPGNTICFASGGHCAVGCPSGGVCMDQAFSFGLCGDPGGQRACCRACAAT